MFRNCVHCLHDLGDNEVLPTFPVGERLAFDSVKGRLWVICPACSRWNLSPLEERWEAVEECERRFRGEKLRAQTPDIGYVKLREGTGLVRIGAPLRPEFAAWRYGREFSRRRHRNMLILGATGLAVAGIAAGGIAFGAAMFLPHAGMYAYNFYRLFQGGPSAFNLPRGHNRAWEVSGNETPILPDPTFGWRLSVKHHFGRHESSGPDAQRLLASIMVRVNRSGGSERLVQDAVKDVQEHPAEKLLREIAVESGKLWSFEGPMLAELDRAPWQQQHPVIRAGLSQLPPSRRLALEMALHETTEQHALEGELAELEVAWREAEEIAGIADNLLVPASTTTFIDANRKR